MTEITVCVGSSCHLKGSYNVISTFQQMIEEYALHDKLDFKAAFCMKRCGNEGVAVSVNGVEYDLPPEQARSFFLSTVLEAVEK